jgi:POT family proton-dependent oligopeptide transporter
MPILRNHPAGLQVLFFTEMWERFGFYIMMAIFTLYMDQDFLWDDATKGNVYGLFLGAVFFMPIIGGWIADTWLGHRNTIRVGAVIMTVGYVMLALSSVNRLALFYLALVLVAVGTGLFKANVSVLVGNLYEPGSQFKDAGYNIFYMGINLGAFLAPLAATLVHNLFNSYNISFGLAAVGMVLSMVIFEAGRQKYLYADTAHTSPRKAETTAEEAEASRREERQRLLSLGTLFAIVIFFWMAFYQNGFALTLFAQRSTVIYSYLQPETYQSFGAFFILLLTPFVVWIFGRLREKGKEPPNPVKIFVGMFTAGLSLIIMVGASLLGGDRDVNIMSPYWLISSYFMITIAEILVSPMGLSFVSKVAPSRLRGLMMGCWFGATAIGSYSSGLLGRFYSDLEHHTYFLLLSILLLATSFLVLASLRILKRFA